MYQKRLLIELEQTKLVLQKTQNLSSAIATLEQAAGAARAACERLSRLGGPTQCSSNPECESVWGVSHKQSNCKRCAYLNSLSAWSASARLPLLRYYMTMFARQLLKASEDVKQLKVKGAGKCGIDVFAPLVSNIQSVTSLMDLWIPLDQITERIPAEFVDFKCVSASHKMFVKKNPSDAQPQILMVSLQGIRELLDAKQRPSLAAWCDALESTLQKEFIDKYAGARTSSL